MIFPWLEVIALFVISAFPGHVLMFVMVIGRCKSLIQEICKHCVCWGWEICFCPCVISWLSYSYHQYPPFFLVLEATFTLSNMSLAGFRRFLCDFLFIHRLQCHAPCSCLRFCFLLVTQSSGSTSPGLSSLTPSFWKIPTSSATFVLIVCSIDRRCLHEVMRAFLCGWGWVYSSYTDSRLNIPPLYLLQLSEEWYISVAFSTFKDTFDLWTMLNAVCLCLLPFCLSFASL